MNNRPRVILVDDNKQFVDLMSVELGNCGIDNRIAYNGPEAVKLLAEWPAQIMMLDIEMPIMNGYETAITIHRLDGFMQFPIVAWSTNNCSKPIHFLDEARFSGWLTKPVGVQQILDVITRLTTRGN